jgi:hypothetical protein
MKTIGLRTLPNLIMAAVLGVILKRRRAASIPGTR